MTLPGTVPAKTTRLGALLAIYLLGIFMGAIDTGIVTPARTLIQNDLGVDDKTGVWMLTIYTLAYAASIPVMGKLADRYGRKPIYLISITLFGLGSLLCGLSQDVGSFELLIAARAIQALGGGGIVPIATAEFGTSVPAEKRGMALGLVGGVYGVANIFGSSAGSLILDAFGAHNWQYIFYVNVPISVVIIVAGLILLPNHKAESVAKIDLLGITLLVAMILSLLYGLRNIDFFDLSSLSSLDVYPFLLAFVLLAPVFVLAERRAADPVLNLGYFTDFAIGVTLLLALLSGVILMGVIFVPQFAENALRIPTGQGGYFVIILGLFSGIGAPLSGTLTDKFGPKVVLGFGVITSAIAAAVGAWWAIPSPSWWSVCITLALMGLGLGFTIGSPLNYMMLDRTPAAEANSALATLSLVRSIGTTLAPAFLIGFLAHAGTGLQAALTAELPTKLDAPTLPYASELEQRFSQLKKDPNLKDKLAGVNFPDLGGQSVTIDINGGGSLPPDLVELLKTADVTTITERTKTVADRMFAQQTPSVIADITDGVNTGLASLDQAATDLDKAHAKLTKAVNGIQKGIDGMEKARTGMRSGVAGMTKAINGMTKGIDGMSRGLRKLDSDLARLRQARAGVQAAYDQIMDALPPGTPEPPPAQQLHAQLTELDAAIAGAGQGRAALADKQKALKAQRATLVGKRAALRTSLHTLDGKLAKAGKDRTKLINARDELAGAQAELADSRAKLVVLRDAVPGAFETSRTQYLAKIDELGPTLQSTFASTLNEGFRGIYLSTLVAALLAAGLLVLYPRRAKTE
ncbi:EmrB/QacA subfamily drug resistance transporter [Propionicimonas paludicola]|uniref:EmrB/QacA subfamily drug resistance transporter n=1 Tax=Propionicimonas paludicola TaxID=185243 RepID=A0A2A9CRS7_9ACTN|nr:MFS transporter [Propionicimonas paludicola]PFG16795.1 EmrB/QacA subfamily drug resistance transporter [Propionicimonas paludicola]